MPFRLSIFVVVSFFAVGYGFYACGNTDEPVPDWDTILGDDTTDDDTGDDDTTCDEDEQICGDCGSGLGWLYNQCGLAVYLEGVTQSYDNALNACDNAESPMALFWNCILDCVANFAADCGQVQDCCGYCV